MGTLNERNPSIWVKTSGPGDYPRFSGDTTADVVVIGAGITGLTTARLLVEQGASVVVVEAGSLCAGATGYSTAKASSLHGIAYRPTADRFSEEHARLYGEANEAGIAELVRLIELDGIDCDLERKSHVVYTTDPDTARSVLEEKAFAVALGLPVASDTPDELPFAVAASFAFENQAQLHPRSYCLGLARAIADAGGRIFTHTRAVDVRHSEREVVTEHGVITADSIVVASHLPINNMGAYFARAVPLRGYALAASVAGPVPQEMYISADEPTRSLRTYDGRLIAAGEAHKVGDGSNTQEHYQNLENWVCRSFPIASIDYRWSTQDWKSADDLPYIGRMAGGGDDIYVATAFNKWGIAAGVAAAMIIRDLIDGRENPWHELYDATRIALPQNIKGIISESIDSAKHLVGDRIGMASSSEVEQLGPGQGVVIRKGTRPIAAARDDSGRLHVVSAVCTHLGCIVDFNEAEQSWDCPCHGSRFNIDGRVLEGPTVQDLPSEVI